MAGKKRSVSGGSGAASGVAQYVKLEQRLHLLAWLNRRFGYESNKEMLADIKGCAEGFDASGSSFIFHHFAGRGQKVKIQPVDLARYDDNIREHLRAMNARRKDPITLRYFQYLAALYTEIFLDLYFNHRGIMLQSLNSFIEDRGASMINGGTLNARFSEPDLKKLAFWMATGSGKTLIMHLNYRQFLHYNTQPLDNILLITPNEGLSEQHMAEMEASNILASRFDLNESGLLTSGKEVVRVIEITKLVEEKRGGGVSVPVEAFEGNNLIFVDEGHKGSGGEVWRGYRDRLGETGFTFEYSATFGQALTATRDDELTAEYGKDIVFDYSYHYFYGDGYGKDFRVLNLQEETTADKTETLLLGNLLSFYEQQRLFEEKAGALHQYNLEKPLWVFVGSTVNAVYTEDAEKRSDVLIVARFLHHVLENKRGWVVSTIKKIMEGKTGIVADDRDIFEGKLKYLRQINRPPERMYRDILAKVFHAPAGGGLHLCEIKSGAGEIGLKAAGAEDYFGLIYIGDTGAFKALVEEDDSGITLEGDAVSGSLFSGIGERDTSIDILIGAKKFMEGWNSWRVSNMGLLNIGRKEGAQIIQLFGRGVRLRGMGLSLKRSSALDGKHPEYLGLLETLNIFAVRANYMAQFREYLEREGIEIDGDVELSLAIKPNRDFLGKGLVVPRVPENRSFVQEADMLLTPDPGVVARVDMSLKVQAMESGAGGVVDVEGHSGHVVSIPAKSLELVDWEKVYLELLEYKDEKGLVNLVVRPDMPRRILEKQDPNRLYNLIADDSLVAPVSFADAASLHEAVVSILKKYLERFYRVQQERWDSEHMVYTVLTDKDPNFQNYRLSISRSEAALIAAVKKLIDEGSRIYREYTSDLPNIHFDRHLYQPLLVEKVDKIKRIPPGLNEGERRFVEDMKAFCKSERDGVFANCEVFLLRNLSRGKGVGFFENSGFYPDFILWVKKEASQRIVFIEPHGMIFAKSYLHDDKAKLHESLPELSEKMSRRSKLKRVSLDSYIISKTPFEVLREYYGDDVAWDRQRFAEKHILFPERNEEYDYLRAIMG